MRSTPNGILTTQEVLHFCSLSRDGEQGFKNNLEYTDQEKFIRRRQGLEEKSWKISHNDSSYSQHGYYGVCCYKIDLDSGILHVVFSHRGTCFDKLGNILADIRIAQKKLPEILEESSVFIQQCLNTLRKNYKFHPLLISHTGFSLGGFIAGASAADNLAQGYDAEAITVDSPGIRSYVLSKSKDYKGYDEKKTIAPKIFNYVSSPNMVNTCNKHTGKVLLMAWLPEEKTIFTTSFKLTIEQLDITKESNKSILEKLKKEMEYTLRLHDFPSIIDGFESKLQGAFPFKRVYKWPVATISFLEADRPTMIAFHLLSIPISVALVADDQNMYTGGLLALNVALGALWKFTKHTTPAGVEIGVVGLHDYYRRNKVYFTQDEYNHDMRWMRGLVAISAAATIGGVQVLRQPVVSAFGVIGLVFTNLIYGREGMEAIRTAFSDNHQENRTRNPSVATTPRYRLSSSPLSITSSSSSSSSSSNSSRNRPESPSFV